jgi:hypothetical protein
VREAERGQGERGGDVPARTGERLTTTNVNGRFWSGLHKLRGRSPQELRARAAQLTAAYLERLGLSAESREPTDRELWRQLDSAQCPPPYGDATSLLARFRQRTEPRFYPGLDETDVTVSAWCEKWPDAESLLESADRICEGRFDLLGYRDLSFGIPVDWHRDPVAGTTAPRVHWSLVDYLNPNLVGDHKLVWELNRHQHFVTLGRAYWRSGNEKYARVFVRHLTEWMDANPPKQGVNWASSLEVAFRVIAWLWALYFFRSSPALSSPVFVRVLKWLYLHGRHLERYPSAYFSPNTHLTGEALGLVYLGTLLPELRRSGMWRAMGWRILREQARRQVRTDGVYFEQSSYYHRYTADIYLHAVLLARANDDPVGEPLARTLEALLDHLLHLTRPDGRTPLFGDDDGGRVIPLDDREPNDFRAALATGAALFNRPDYAYVAREPAEETLWLLGPDGVRRFDSLCKIPPRQMSCAFRQGGYFVMRDGWDERSNYAVIDCGPHGGLTAGHAHADALAFELAAHGRPFLVDIGTFTYTRSPSERNRFRVAAAHNTVTVDGQSSSVPGSAFKWHHAAQATLTTWLSRSSFDYFEGTHDGYARLAAPATHVRGILFLKAKYWVMRDRIQSRGFHRVSVHFHFAPRVAVHSAHGPPVTLAAEAEDESMVLRIASFGQGTSLICEQGWVSNTYGARECAPVCSVVAEGTGTQDIVTFLLPCEGHQPDTCIREIDASTCKAFEVVQDDVHDTLLLDAHPESEADRVIADASWAWVRRSRITGDARDFLLISGRTLRVNGVSLLELDHPAGFVAGSRVGRAWRIDTDAEGRLTFDTMGAPEIVLNGRPYAVSGPTVTVELPRMAELPLERAIGNAASKRG